MDNTTTATASDDSDIDTKMSRSAVFAGDGRIELADAPVPTPGPDDVLIQLEGCGVCSSNVPTWEGRPWFDYPQEPGAGGHEGWGVVTATGSNVTSVEEGDRVAALSHASYAEYDVAPADRVIKLPAALEGMPFPGEPLGCAMNIFKRCDIRAGHDVAIVGIGFLGALLTQLAQANGARVIGLSRRAFALEVARASGAEAAVSLHEDDAEEKVIEWTGGDGCDRVIEATGKEDPLNLAARLTKVRGRLIIAGYHQDGSREVNMQLWNWRGIDVINAHERDPEIYMEGIKEALDAVVDGQLDPAPLFTHTFPLEDLSSAFEMIEDRPAGFMKALVLHSS